MAHVDQQATMGEGSAMSRMATIVLSVLVALDILFIVLHSLYGWSIINLDEEGNLTAWYSSVKLLGLAALSVLIWISERKASRHLARQWAFPWLIVAAIFVLLSMDETASIHERLSRFFMSEHPLGLDIREAFLHGDRMKDSFAWVILLSPFIAGTILFFGIFFTKRFLDCRPALYASLVALGMFVMVVALESTIYFVPSLKEWTDGTLDRYRMLASIEESGEILGSTLFGFAFLKYLFHCLRKQPE